MPGSCTQKQKHELQDTRIGIRRNMGAAMANMWGHARRCIADRTLAVAWCYNACCTEAVTMQAAHVTAAHVRTPACETHPKGQVQYTAFEMHTMVASRELRRAAPLPFTDPQSRDSTGCPRGIWPKAATDNAPVAANYPTLFPQKVILLACHYCRSSNSKYKL